jgi:type VI secretion system ImpC/EvpB family protein
MRHAVESGTGSAQGADPAASHARQQAATTAPLLEQLTVAGERPATASESARLQRFLAASSAAEALQEWLGGQTFPGRGELVAALNRHVAAIDELLDGQLNAILHADPFQRLEASWRGLKYLVDQVDREDDPDRRSVHVRVLHVTWKELQRDFDNALEFDQSHVFRKVYEEEFGMAGGRPFGVLIGDFQVRAHSRDYDVLVAMSQVAAAAFCPFVTNASPDLLGLDDFGDLERSLDHERTFAGLEYLPWRSLRDREDARFLGITLPRVLMRLPYQNDGSRAYGFQFQEDVAGPDRRKYLWGGAAFALAGNLIRAFARTGWLADIHGVRRDYEGGGLATDLPVHCFATDNFGLAPRSSTDVVITDELEKQLSDLGFVSLCDCQDTPFSAFYSLRSVQQPRRYTERLANTNARISSMLHSILCASRFAHYVKVLGRDNIGRFTTARDMQRFLQNWIAEYVTSDADADLATKAAYPLREARVDVEEMRGRAGEFQAVLRLLPHYEIDGITTGIRLVAELHGPRSNQT